MGTNLASRLSWLNPYKNDSSILQDLKHTNIAKPYCYVPSYPGLEDCPEHSYHLSWFCQSCYRPVCNICRSSGWHSDVAISNHVLIPISQLHQQSLVESSWVCFAFNGKLMRFFSSLLFSLFVHYLISSPPLFTQFFTKYELGISTSRKGKGRYTTTDY